MFGVKEGRMVIRKVSKKGWEEGENEKKGNECLPNVPPAMMISWVGVAASAVDLAGQEELVIYSNGAGCRLKKEQGKKQARIAQPPMVGICSSCYPTLLDFEHHQHDLREQGMIANFLNQIPSDTFVSCEPYECDTQTLMD